MTTSFDTLSNYRTVLGHVMGQLWYCPRAGLNPPRCSLQSTSRDNFLHFLKSKKAFELFYKQGLGIFGHEAFRVDREVLSCSSGYLGTVRGSNFPKIRVFYTKSRLLIGIHMDCMCFLFLQLQLLSMLREKNV